MSDESFLGAGSKVGLELWRMENLACVKIPDSEVKGKFYVVCDDDALFACFIFSEYVFMYLFVLK
jgi:hypothetical protein